MYNIILYMVQYYTTISANNPLAWVIGIIILIICCSIICCCLSSITSLFKPPVTAVVTPPIVTPPVVTPPITPPITPPVVTPPIIPPVVTPPVVTPPVVTPPIVVPPVVTPPATPKIKFCSQPNLTGNCKAYDLTYKFYPINSECGSDPIGFKPRSIEITNDDPSKYNIKLRGYYANPNDTNCGPSQLPLNANPECYKSNIYGISNDRGTCINDTASGVNWIDRYVNGGINVER